MPGTFTGNVIVIVAPAAGVHQRADKTGEQVPEGDAVYMQVGHSLRCINGAVFRYTRDTKQGYPFIETKEKAR